MHAINEDSNGKNKTVRFEENMLENVIIRAVN
jgi:hypothetical protein